MHTRASGRGQHVTHKRRSSWYRESSAWPFREPTAEQLAEGRNPQSQPAAVQQPPRWRSVGPTNFGGRMTSVVAHPNDSGKILAGAAGGGVWQGETTRNGWDWKPASKGLPCLNVGSLALDRRDPQPPVVYCGTGEANLSADGHPGSGLFKSEDWGLTWSVVAIPTRDRIPGRIGSMAVDPEDSKHLMIGGVGHRSDKRDASGGLFRSTDEGANWSLVEAISPAPYWCHDVIFDPDDSSYVYASVTTRGAKSGIWRSFDKGETWEQLWQGLPQPEQIFRTSLAAAPSKAGWLYALAADRYGGVLGVFQSQDYGSNWSEIGHGHFANESAMSYNNTIAVHPEKHLHVICGGVDLHLWDGARWYQVSSWSSRAGQSEYAHADHHCLLMPQEGLVYDMNDGGMAVSTDGGLTWEDRSAGLVTTMFYDLDVAPKDRSGRTMGGGTQDNGTLVTTGGSDTFADATGADGGWMAFDLYDAKRFYSSIYNAGVYVHHEYPDGWREDISPPEEQWIKDELFVSPLKIHPRRSDTVYFGTTRVWQSKPLPERKIWWQPLSDELDSSPISALEVAGSDGSYLYAGTENGGVFVSQDRGMTWSGDLSSRVLPGAMITRIRAHPREPLRILLCVGRIGHSHVFRSKDGGSTWEDVNQDLPDMPFRALVIDPANPEVVYAGSDVGIYVSEDFGESWRNFTGDLPKVAVTDLVIHEETRRIHAATYGRGIWRTKLT